MLRHGNELIELAWSPDGKRFVTTDGSSLRLWSAAGVFEAELLAEQYAAFKHLAWSPDGNWLAAGDDKVFLYDLTKRTVVWTLALEGDTLEDLAFSADSLTLAIASDNQECHHLGPPPSVGLWVRDVETGKPLREYAFADGTFAVAYSPDGKLFVYGDDQLRFVDPARTRPFATIDMRASRLEFSRDGKTLFVSGHDAGANRTFAGIDVATRKVTPMPAGAGYASDVSPDGTTLVVIDGKELKVVDLATGTVARTVAAPEASGVIYAPDGASVTVLVTGGQPRTLDPSLGTWIDGGGHASAITTIACTPDGSSILTSTDDGTRIWDAKGTSRIALPTGPLVAARWSPDHTQVITATEDGTVRWWNPATGAQTTSVQVTRPLLALEVLADGRLVASSGPELQVWRADGTLDRTIKALGTKDEFGEPTISYVAASADGSRLWTGGFRGHVWNTATWTDPVQLGIASEGYGLFAPDGARLLVADSNQIDLYELAKLADKPAENRAISGGSYRSLAVSPEAKYLAAAGYQSTGITEYPAGTKSRPLGDVSGKGTAVAFCGPDRIAVGYSTGQALVWSISAVMR
jgi:WD40 repeat protein